MIHGKTTSHRFMLGALVAALACSCATTPETPDPADDQLQTEPARPGAMKVLRQTTQDGTETTTYAPDEAPISSDQAHAIISAQATDSFWATCRPYKETDWSGSVIVFAYSDSCQRRDKTWGGPTAVIGSCATDVANCNGLLHCGRC